MFLQGKEERKIKMSKKKPGNDESGDEPIPSKSCKKSPPDELGAGTSSELKSSKSTRGAVGGLATPFGRLTETPEEFE